MFSGHSDVLSHSDLNRIQSFLDAVITFQLEIRNFRTKTGKTFPKSSGNIKASEFDDYTSAITKTLRYAYGENRGAAKSLMRITGAGERTVKNWLEGKNAPSGENLIELVRHSDEVLETILLITGRHEILTMKMMLNVRDDLVQMVALIDELVPTDIDDLE